METSNWLSHCMLFFSLLKQNNPISRQIIPKQPKITILLHKLTLKPNSATPALSPPISFSTNTIKAYLKGVTYCIHPIHGGKLLLFLNKPLKQERGSNRKMLQAIALFASLASEATSNPNEIPLKLSRKIVRRKMKNCCGVLLKPTNQQSMRHCSSGNTKEQGTYMIFLLIKYDVIPYNLEFYSLRNTSLSVAKMRTMGIKLINTPFKDKKKPKPCSDTQAFLLEQS